MVPTVIAIPVVTNSKQKKATEISTADWNSLLKPMFLVGKENLGGRLSTEHRQSLTMSPGFAGCTVSCPQLAADPRDLGHLDWHLMAQEPSPISQDLSESAHCRQLTKHPCVS